MGDGARFVWFHEGTLQTASWDGTGAQPVSAATEVLEGRAWGSPDGSAVTFLDGGTLRVAAFDGSFDHRLTEATDVWEYDRGPRWSPDGAHVAFLT